MNDGLKAWLGPAYDELTESQREMVADEAADLRIRYPESDLEDVHLNAYVQVLLGEDEKPKVHRYLISYAIIVGSQHGTGSAFISLDHPLNEDDVRQVLADQREHARANFDSGASMPNVTSVWKFED